MPAMPPPMIATSTVSVTQNSPVHQRISHQNALAQRAEQIAVGGFESAGIGLCAKTRQHDRAQFLARGDALHRRGTLAITEARLAWIGIHAARDRSVQHESKTVGRFGD